jgi:hypothetical protein
MGGTVRGDGDKETKASSAFHMAKVMNMEPFSQMDTVQRRGESHG